MNTPRPQTEEEYQALLDKAPPVTQAAVATVMAIIEATRHPTLADDSRADISRTAMMFYHHTIIAQTLKMLLEALKTAPKEFPPEAILATIALQNIDRHEKVRHEFSNLMELLK